MSRLIAVLLCTALALPALADIAHREQVAAAIAALDAANMDERWQFTMTLRIDDEQRVVTHDPTRGGYDVRQLVSVDGDPPSDKERKTFRDEEKKRLDEQDPETNNYAYLVDLNSLQLEDTQGDVRAFSFAPRVKEFDEADKLRGTLHLNNATGHVESLRIENSDELSPAFSVTVSHYVLAFSFVDAGGVRLLGNMVSQARGKAGFLKSFATDVEVTFDDYKLAPAN